jgi:hypothetical protein
MRPVTCTNCQTRFALGLLACPRCRTVSPQYAANVKKEEVMPHTTVGGGPSNAGAQPGEVGFIGRAEHKGASKPLAHLREAAKNRGLPTAGNKADLAARLDEHEAAQDTPEPAKANAAPAAEEVSA